MLAGGIPAVSSLGTLNPFLVAILSASPPEELDMGAPNNLDCSENSFESLTPASPSSAFVLGPILWVSDFHEGPTFPFSAKKIESDFEPNSSFEEFDRVLELEFGGGQYSIVELLSSVPAMNKSVFCLIQVEIL